MKEVDAAQIGRQRNRPNSASSSLDGGPDGRNALVCCIGVVYSCSQNPPATATISVKPPSFSCQRHHSSLSLSIPLATSYVSNVAGVSSLYQQVPGSQLDPSVQLLRLTVESFSPSTLDGIKERSAAGISSSRNLFGSAILAHTFIGPNPNCSRINFASCENYIYVSLREI